MNDLLNLEDIAVMHRCSQRHARDVLVRLPGFPSEAPTSTPRNRLWLRTEVRSFVTRKSVAPKRQIRADMSSALSR